MKSILSCLISACLFIGCTNKELPSEYLTQITVVRETENNYNTNPIVKTVQETDHSISTVSPTSKSQPKYHVIVSSFGSTEKARAEKLVSQLKAKNYPATLIYSSQRYRVSIESFTTETEANSARDEYRTTTDRQDIWVHKVQ